MRLSRAEAKRVALNRTARRAAAQKMERRMCDGLPAVPVVAPAPRMSRRRLKAWLAARAAPGPDYPARALPGPLE